jgi:hypothetical protein
MQEEDALDQCPATPDERHNMHVRSSPLACATPIPGRYGDPSAQSSLFIRRCFRLVLRIPNTKFRRDIQEWKMEHSRGDGSNPNSDGPIPMAQFQWDDKRPGRLGSILLSLPGGELPSRVHVWQFYPAW